jgi:hypothetical protein
MGNLSLLASRYDNESGGLIELSDSPILDSVHLAVE